MAITQPAYPVTTTQLVTHVGAYTDTQAGGAVQKSVIDAAGDLLVGTADNTVGRLQKGTDGQVLTVDPVTHLLAWKDPPVSAGDVGGSVLFSNGGTIGASGSYRVTGAATIERAVLSCVEAPDGSDLVVRLFRNATQLATFTIVEGATGEDLQELGVAVVAGDRISVNATSVGSITPAVGIVLQADIAAG
jgi:hypothetical protein